ncbi:restriction endonuclease [Streptomyces caatingaensis]|uniref:restriction endonuclease n=1 Tax=Streptomyces caatingaensis TaxID=1678637 RepID=UPI00099D3900|nr:restriction endonuclease [Streptomyces caatingaensis]
MGAEWDWGNDRGVLEWLTELISVKIGLAVSDSALRTSTRTSATRLLSKRAGYKEAYEKLGRHTLEEFGLDGTVKAGRGIIPGVHDRVGDLSLAVRASAFVHARLHRPRDIEREEKSFLLEGISPGAASIHIPITRVEPARARELISEAQRKHGAELRKAVSDTIEEMNFRVSRNLVIPSDERRWPDVIELAELFESESVTASCGRFFDQRFVNYLANNYEEIGSVNWRKFEALVAEYFHRAGYEVQLGAGRNDNGVDVRVWESGTGIDESPPTVIIQCKREKRKISKVVIKALAEDVRWEKAKKGMLVATVDWSPGAREVAKTRSFPLEEVNGDAVHRWLREMRSMGSGLWILG